MTGLTCAAVRQRLAAFHDDELAVQERIAVQSHVNTCDGCQTELAGYREVAGALRLAAAPAPAGIDGLAVQAPSVPEDGLISASLERSGQGAEQMLAFAAVITRSGNIAAMQALGEGRGSRQVAALITELSRGRLEPARYGADPL